MAIIVAERSIVCTQICCGFPRTTLVSTVLGCPFQAAPETPVEYSMVTTVTPQEGHFQASRALVLSLHVTGVRLIP